MRILIDGPLANFVRRYDALIKLERLLKKKKFVSARQIAAWLGPDVRRRLDLAKKQEKAGAGEKPDAVKSYEIDLQRADMMHMNAQKFVSRGKLLKNYTGKLQAHRQEARRLYRHALSSLEQRFLQDPDVRVWFDRPLVFEGARGIEPEFAGMPRVRAVNEVRKLRGKPGGSDKRGNWLHLKHGLVKQELDRMRPIYLALQSALEEIESSTWNYPAKALARMQLNASRERVNHYLKLHAAPHASTVRS